MNNQPKVSIILVNYNGFKDTIDCLYSLRNLTYKNFEVMIVDNASTNDSAEEIKPALTENEVLLEADENRGFSAGNNIGIRYAMDNGADYCLLLNNDTVVEPDFLGLLIEAFRIYPKCGLSIGKILYESQRDVIWYAGGSLNLKTARTEHWHYQEKISEENDKMQKVTFATGCCMCLSAEAIKKVGLMDEDFFLYEEDADYSIRFINAGYEIFYVPQARIYHKVSASTGSKSGIAQYYTIRNKYKMIDKNFSGFNKVTAKTYSTAQYLFRCAKGQLDFEYFKMGFKAYKAGEIEKTEQLL